MRGLIFFLAAVLAGLPVTAEDDMTYSRLLRLPSRSDVFGDPRAVTADRRTGEIFVADSRFHRVAIFDADGAFRYLFTGGDVWSAPVDIAVDPDGYVLLLATVGGKTRPRLARLRRPAAGERESPARRDGHR